MQKATRQQTKEHNTNLVLKTIYQNGDASRADVARITGLTRTTVSDIVAELIEDGLLEETGVGESAGGKPPILLNLREDGRQMVCLDFSGPVFQGALVNLRGKISQRESLGRDGQGGDPALQLVYRLAQHLIDCAEAPVIGIGAGVPGLCDLERGLVRRSVTLDWADVPVQKLLEDRFHLPTYLLNDSHAAALAEYTFGELRQAPNLIVVRIGAGIGAGILLSGQLHFGDGYGAGEIGHLTVVEGGRQCSCGNYVCLETVASPGAILQRMRELAQYEWISFAAGRQLDPERIDWDFVRDAFRSGDETVTELVKEAGRYLGISIANLVSILNIHRIVISGSYNEFGEDFLEAIHHEVNRRSLPTMAVETKIVYSTLDPDNVILGTSALVLSKEAGLP
jgi:predicted NBD/HSP70 family sugar kinase